MKDIEFIPVPINATWVSPGRDVIGKENIVLQGNILGEMICRENFDEPADYHACLNINPDGVLSPASGLAQGHGANRAEAIKDALIKSREAATDYLASLDHLAQQINGSEAA
ncbi:hypothetical protein [Microbulbifer sp. 2205BS26-8]|uniref:hypothetical protein n=1 Tax=Microbulbifer sp. 2205BS26-8 TaxID=3064386 RepID=UPI00273DBD37|nr:hypothetical protein [Microbulbifer sp. 2205BS26-8]MDP5210969.1 hypothetical protein [Microbulbifer sp. 2205BS26-8]